MEIKLEQAKVDDRLSVRFNEREYSGTVTRVVAFGVWIAFDDDNGLEDLVVWSEPRSVRLLSQGS